MKHSMRQRKRHSLKRVDARWAKGQNVLYYTHPTHRWPVMGFVVSWRPRQS